MFVPVPIVIAVGLILLLAIARIVRLSRRRDPLLGSTLPPLRPTPVAEQEPPATPPAALPPEIDRRVRDLIGRGRTIEAIKLVRDATGLGLKDSKDLVDAL